MPARTPSPSTIAVWVLAVLAGGANPVGVRLAVVELDPFWAAGSRFAIASLIFTVAMIVGRRPIGSWASVAAAFAYGLVNIGMAFALIYWGLQRTPAGTGQVLIAITPLATLVLASLHGLEPLRFRPIVGALIAFAGVGVVFADQVQATVPGLSLLAVVAGALCLSEGIVVLKLAPDVHPITTNAIGMAVGAAFLASLSVAVGEDWSLPRDGQTWAAMIYLISGGTVVFSWLTVFIVHRWTAAAASYLFVMLPPVAIGYGAVFAGEAVSGGFLLGGTLIIIGVWFSGVLSTPHG